MAIQSMGTGFMIGEGSLEVDGTIETHAEYPNPVSGKMTRYREVHHIENEDHHWLEMHTIGLDGKEVLTLEIQCVRKK